MLDLLEVVIERMKKEVASFTVIALWNFYKELMIYGDELMVQGK